MNIKKLRRKCGVRGCKNTGAYSITKVREHGSTVIICKECAKSAYEAMESPAETKVPALTEPPQTQTESEPKYICSKCGKVCSSQSGLTNHEKACGDK